jgi:sialate O-acetylesterase
MAIRCNKYIFILGFLLISLLKGTLCYAQEGLIKVACIGNSVTSGTGLKWTYPIRLQQLLGIRFEVKNFGVSGTTLLSAGHKPYIKTDAFQNALLYEPDIAIIHLGLNDTDPRNWPDYRDNFISDYYALIDSFRKSNGDIRIYICMLTPIFSGHSRFISGTRDWFWQIQNLIPVIAKSRTVDVIDLHTPLYKRPDLFPDNLHPTEDGAAIIANTLYSFITGNYGNLKMPEVFGDHMVLQQQMPIPVYGTANANDTVTVIFDREQKIIKADSYGKWKVEFKERKAGGPFEIQVATVEKELLFKDIYIGEVWLCAGQSNMAFPLKNSQGGQQEGQHANNSMIRLFKLSSHLGSTGKVFDSVTLDRLNQHEYYKGQWEVSDSNTANNFSAIGYHFGKSLHNKLNVRIGLIQMAAGGSTTESWIDRFSLEHHPQLVHILMNWRKSDFTMQWVRDRADENLAKATVLKQRHPFDPSYNFESGISKIVQYPFKGVIWYQGESNTHNSELHEVLFRTLVSSWRKQFGRLVPFYYVQLSSLNRPSFPVFRDSQRKLMNEITNTGMAVTTDLGDSTNVHPWKKKEVGERLALWALSDTYGFNVVPSGPLVQSFWISGKHAIGSFKFNKGMKASNGDEIKGFEIAGEDMLFYKADAIVKRNKVIVSNALVPHPKYVRYAWEPFSRANLVNKLNLPASTFYMEVLN